MLRIANVLYGSEVNGPGLRNVIHTQGCDLQCPGCFNTHTHPHQGGDMWHAADLVRHVQQKQRSRNYTISGGEPFQQPDLYRLVECLRARGVDSILVFTGYKMKEILSDGVKARALLSIDVLVSGRFNRTMLVNDGLRASGNQSIYRITDRHTEYELRRPPGVEIHIEGGKQVITGFPTPAMLEALT